MYLVFAARTGAEKVSFAWRVGELQLRLCRRPTRGRQSPRPLDPGLRPASPPLRGPFASSGFLTDRRDAPSLARTRLFAASLPLVLKSLIRSAVLTASLPRFISSFCVGYVIAVSLKDYLRLSAWQEEWPSTLADISYFCVGYFIGVSLKDYLCLSAWQEEWLFTLSNVASSF
ncbi:hypothetical protein [Pantoea sp. UBA3896]|uniref:hypothetical protein n=1 Tax=Pantoea sp. UBA3896 TaxID=1947031 RepID=UPI0025794898|nr:hypothetical protein [Pantoea sp. UBA3896]